MAEEDVTESHAGEAFGRHRSLGRKKAVMTKFGKVLAVFTLFASFAFLGIAWVSFRGGPNWDAEAAALSGYTIQQADGGKWTVTDRLTNQAVTVASSTVEAAAIVAARKDLDKKQNDEITALADQTDKYKKKLAAAKKYNTADVKALESRVTELTAQLNELNAKIVKLSADFVKRSQEAQAIRAEVTKRREDVFRLSRELQEIRTDNFRADELQKKLRDQLVRLDGVVAALESRNKQLRATVQPN
jgi:predicted RNase H-like nuclease (RuvC/YqgF family)